MIINFRLIKNSYKTLFFISLVFFGMFLNSDKVIAVAQSFDYESHCEGLRSSFEGSCYGDSTDADDAATSNLCVEKYMDDCKREMQQNNCFCFVETSRVDYSGVEPRTLNCKPEISYYFDELNKESYSLYDDLLRPALIEGVCEYTLNDLLKIMTLHVESTALINNGKYQGKFKLSESKCDGIDFKSYARVAYIQDDGSSSENRSFTTDYHIKCQSFLNPEESEEVNIAKANAVIEEIKKELSSLDQLNLEGKNMTEKIQNLIGRVIQYVLGFTGSIALAMFVFGGLIWMTARGNAEKTAKALKMMTWASLGVVVILSSYVILNFIFDLFK